MRQGNMAEVTMCIVCTVVTIETPNRVKTESAGDNVRVTCPRCGDYVVRDKFLKAHKGGFPMREALALSAAIREATNREETIEITEDNRAQVAAVASRSFSYNARVDRILLDLMRRNPYPGNQTRPFNLQELAAIACMPMREMPGLMNQLSQAGWLGIGAVEPDTYRVTLSPQAWRRIDELQSMGPIGQRAFVAMAFSEEMRPIYEGAIRPALMTCGYDPPFRVDDREHEARADHPDYKNKIDDRIMAEIRRARFLIVDVTLGRQAVYFEAGFGEGLGIPIVWTCRESNKADMCFDTRQNGHILWTDAADLRRKLKDRIQARGWDRARSGTT
jgi:hypothetical protein